MLKYIEKDYITNENQTYCKLKKYHLENFIEPLDLIIKI